MEPIIAILISDEEETTQLLKSFAEDNLMIINMVGTESDVDKSMTLINSHKPQLVFIDISKRNESLIDLINELDFNRPKVIFISSDQSYAVKAFRLNVIDFLLKPLNFNDVLISVYKAIKRIEMEDCFQEKRVNDINILSSKHHNNGYMAVSSIDKIELINMDHIIYCKAEGKYTEFFLDKEKKILSSKNLGEYSTILDPNYFFRIHHSYVINIRQIINISKKDGYTCKLTNGVILPIAKRRQEEFTKFIKL
ncbi:LytR/AlgR family response regulator transcription factor [Flavobacterium frigoris]|uniref:Response regulator n=1 Tax=Flavobacterium frigoris (strain PS1) TaxID=1086011 RepID=H7FSU9_FLAFP|nr:LytTR family DNA-binding domain-containing protein [Flavobacterium frigoris]EIA08658.1 response regulator [Flavobacterium frigoris PS1]